MGKRAEDLGTIWAGKLLSPRTHATDADGRAVAMSRDLAIQIRANWPPTPRSLAMHLGKGAFFPFLHSWLVFSFGSVFQFDSDFISLSATKKALQQLQGTIGH